jgi:hypothetical protein
VNNVEVLIEFCNGVKDTQTFRKSIETLDAGTMTNE